MNIDVYKRQILAIVSGQVKLFNSDGLRRAIQEVSLYLLGGAALHTVLSILKVSYNQNIGRVSLSLVSVYNIVANNCEIVGVASLQSINLCVVGNLVPLVVYLNLSNSAVVLLGRSYLSGGYVDLSNSGVAGSGVGVGSNYGPVVLCVAFVDIEVIDVLGTNLVGDGNRLGTCIDVYKRQPLYSAKIIPALLSDRSENSHFSSTF